MISGTMMFILGFFMFANIAVIKIKLEKDRYADAAVDAGILVLLGVVMGGSLNGLVLATVASAMFSTYLYISPVPNSWFGGEDESPEPQRSQSQQNSTKKEKIHKKETHKKTQAEKPKPRRKKYELKDRTNSPLFSNV